MSAPKTYVLKIFMPGTKLYRVLEAPGDITLDELHEHIHEFMEFPSDEMYAFFPDNKMMSSAGYYAPQMKKQSAAHIRLEQLHLRKEQRILYVYDMSQIKQFYIRVEDILDGYIPKVRLLRRNGRLPVKAIEEPVMEEPLGHDTWRVHETEASMEEMVAANDIDALLTTAYTMNLELNPDWTHEQIAQAIIMCLHGDEVMALRLLTLETLRILEAIWRTSDGDTIMIPYENLIRLSMIGFVHIVKDSSVLEYSVFGREWISAILETPNNLIWLETYMRWSGIARGILRSYGVIQMDDFYHLMKKYIEGNIEIDEACDFMMQRMEWNGDCHALQDGEEWYWSVTEPEQAQRILNRRTLYDLNYKPLTYREILANAESAGWQKVTYAQELFAALQGMAKSQEETKEMLTGIVEAFATGLEPHEVMELCLPPASKVGRPLYIKIRQILRRIRRQLPDFGLKGYSEEEAERMFPDMKSSEGITVIRGNLC